MPALAPFRFSGHETFVCRYAWLPKASREVTPNPLLFKDDDNAMVALGVGKNMVRSIHFWAEMAQVIEQVEDGSHRITSFGQQLIGHDGHEPFLESVSALWLIHWKIATNPKSPLFFWHQLLNFWHRAEFRESEIIAFFEKNTSATAALRSKSTLGAGYRVFVNTYVPGQSAKGEVGEDSLDSPLVELDLLRRVGDSRGGGLQHRETIFAFNLDDKPAVSPTLFAYCLHNFWSNNYPDEQTLPFSIITAAPGSPGQGFKLPEFAVRRRLDLLKATTGGVFTFEESVSLQLAQRKRSADFETLLDAVYAVEA
ncbi:MAG: DUF4007 family protein [Candidatus Synoicihabitans palmerolidicus]|nr:DUF4007 family protein [Candidatus Synoicihabitans palmerolidicus]